MFKSGSFYVFLSDDAKEVSSYTTLKLTSFGDVVKCGFPVASLEKYLEIFKNIGIDVVVVERYEDIVEEIKLQDLNKLSKLEMSLNNKTKIYNSSENINFIGVRKNKKYSNIHRTRKKYKRMLKEYEEGNVSINSLISSKNSYINRKVGVRV